MTFVAYTPALLGQWVVFENQAELLEQALADTPLLDPELNGGVGYIYVDREVGLSLSLDFAAVIDGDGDVSRAIPLRVPGGLQVDLRYPILQELALRPVADHERSLLELPTEPVWLIAHHHPAAEALRGERELDPLRAAEHPDDLRVVLMDDGLQPEAVWGRVQGVTDTRDLLLELITHPMQDFDLSAGDLFTAQVYRDESGQLMLLWQPSGSELFLSGATEFGF
jgi:hypothetical protein